MQAERTSDSHPILVDFIDFRWGSSGRLGITFAPGKKQKDALTGSWLRDLAKDVHRLAKHYQIKTLVSMVEPWEMEELQIQDEFEECKRNGIKTYHYPIVDDHIPETPEEFAKLVREVVDNALRKEQNVVVHCKGGLGRAPTFACACLLYSGKSLDEAVKMVRTARRHSLTAHGQLAFLSKLKF
jgi:ADP-ribosyl-[dinitrogen reductase] hydrolase